MKRTAVYVKDQETLTLVSDALKKEGCMVDPDLKVVRLDSAALYHLIHYTDEELAAVKETEEANGKFDGVTSIKSVPIAEADALLEEGYIILDTYAKTVTLIKKDVDTKAMAGK